MKIQEQDIYHGAALMQIVEHPSFKALNKADEKYGHYLVNTDTRLWFKYASRSEGPWQFTVRPGDAVAFSNDLRLTGTTRMILVCGDVTICCLDEEEIKGLVNLRGDAPQWIKVDAPDGKRMRVTGSQRGRNPLLIPHNKFPGCIFVE